MKVRWPWVAAGLAAAVVVAFGVCEAMGWPFLAKPMQRWLGEALDRRVMLGTDSAQPKVEIRLLGGLRISAGRIEIGAPDWSKAPFTALAHDARLTLGYADLWRASRGDPLRIRDLHAARLEGRMERLADGRASWAFGALRDPDAARKPFRIPEFGRLAVGAGTLVYRDAKLGADMDAKFSLVEGSVAAAPPVMQASTATAPSPAASTPPAGLQFEGKGSYRKQPLIVEVRTSGVMPLVAVDAASIALPVTLNARAGGASLSFKGTSTDALHLGGLKGSFSVHGPSLAAIGDPLGVTLPTTPAFRAEGQVTKEGMVWNALVERASVGASRLAGAFTYDPRPRTPLLSGRLTGARLQLADLGPAVGAPVSPAPAAAVSVSAAAKRADATGAKLPSAASRVGARAGRVLPDREFDLPSLRAMDANIVFDIASLDLGSSILEPLRPFRTHLVLADGVLTLRDIDARTGQGRLAGEVRLDGHNPQALWTADLRWDGIRLERFIRQARADNAPPYATGSLNGQARVEGQGKSTAAILGSLRGGVRMQVAGGTVSNLAIEAAGIDVAQSLGLLIKGDESLRIQCNVADFIADKGVLKPRVFVFDTTDSTLFVDGSVSLATETLDLRVVVTPKDFSPLALRTPLRVHGSFSNPDVSLEKGALGMRVGAAVLLGIINPLAALIPLIDTGNADEAQRGADDCRAFTNRIKAAPALPAPGASKPAPGSAARRSAAVSR